MYKFTLIDGDIVYINPIHVVSVLTGERWDGDKDVSATLIVLKNEVSYYVRESVETVANDVTGFLKSV
jgi:uncharacterized protein YlzI (FlbEa/FlbD family)